MAEVLFAWERDLGDGSSLQVFVDGHRPSGNPDATDWRIGRYSDEGGWIEVLQPFRLDEALEAAPSLPYPRRGDLVVKSERGTVAEAVAFVSGAMPDQVAEVIPVSFGRPAGET